MSVLFGIATVVFLLLAYLADKHELPVRESLGALIIGCISLIATIWTEVSSHLSKSREKEQQDTAREANRAMSQRLNQMIDEVDAFRKRLCDSCRNTTIITELERLEAERNQATTDIEKWVTATVLELNRFHNGWGGRFRAIGIPTQHQKDSGHPGRGLPLIGELVLYREKLGDLLADIDRKPPENL